MFETLTLKGQILRRDIWISLALFFVSFVIHLPFASDHVFVVDAADYLSAAGAGFAANYLNTNTVSPLDMNRIAHDPSVTEGVWDFLYDQDDLSSFRHWHVPVSFFPHALLGGPSTTNRTHRLIGIVWTALYAAAFFLILRYEGAGYLLSFLMAAAVTFAPPVFLTSLDLSPHELYPLVAILTLFSAVAAIERDQPVWYLLSGLLLAFAIATLELSPFLVLVVAATILWSGAWRRFLLHSRFPVALLAGLVLAWPGGIVRGGYLASYGVFVYQALFRREDYFGVSPSGSLLARPFGGQWLDVILYLGLLGAGLAAYLFPRQETGEKPLRLGLLAKAVLLYSGLMLLQGIANGFVVFSYRAEFLVPFTLGLGLVLSKPTERSGWGRMLLIGAMLAFVVLGVAWPARIGKSLRAQDQTATRLEGALAELGPRLHPGTNLVALSHTGTFRLYLPSVRVIRKPGGIDLNHIPLHTCVLLDGATLDATARAALKTRGTWCKNEFVILCEDSTSMRDSVCASGVNP
jgi:hypothetical protein